MTPEARQELAGTKNIYEITWLGEPTREEYFKVFVGHTALKAAEAKDGH